MLATGAVLDVPAGGLAALASDADVDALSADQDVHSTMAVTNAAIGADLLQAGGALAANLGPITGKGVGVAVIDSGVAQRAAACGPRAAAQGLHRQPKQRATTSSATARTWRASSRPRPATRVTARTGVAPGAHIISLKVLDAQGRRQGERRDRGHRLGHRQQGRSSTSR